jgi:hypothetical protein
MQRLFQNFFSTRRDFSALKFLKQLFIWLIILTIHPDGNAQFPDNQRDFDEIFDREFRQSNPQEPSKRRTLRSTLPSWWNKPPSRGHDTIFMIGISDPGLPDTIARAQAHLRAVALAEFCKGTSSAFISDFYQKAGSVSSETKFQEIYRMEPSVSLPIINTRIIRSKKLKSGEVVMWVSIPKNEEPPATRRPGAKVMCYAHESDVATGDAFMWKNTFALSAREIPHSWLPDTTTFYLLNNKFLGVRNLSMKINRTSRYDYLYSPVVKKNPADTTSAFYSTCTTGLWISLVNSIFMQLTTWIRKSTVQTSLLHEQTNTGRSELNREKATLSFHFEIIDFQITTKGLTTNLLLIHEN